MKTITNSKSKKTKSVKNRRSMKGKRGTQVGAPPKPFSLPARPFTMAQAFNQNRGSCQLTVRKKVDSMLADTSLIQLASRKQAKGGVGRPKAVFIKAENFDATVHIRFGDTAPKAQTVAVSTVVPEPEAAPVPVVMEPVIETAPIETIETATEIAQPAELAA